MSVTKTYNFDDNNDAQNVPLNPITGAAAITSLANGGFAGIGDSAGTIFGAIYNSAGIQTATFTPNTGTNGSLDQLSNGNLVMASQTADSVLIKVVNSVNGADIVAPITLNHELGTSNPDVVALSGGGFWVVSQTHFNGNDNDINFDIFDNNGVLVNASVLDVSLADDRDAAVTQLDGGNMVISWTRTIGAETEIWYSVLSAAGATIKAPALFDTTGVDNKHVDVTAINGGGFAMVYQDSEWSAAHASNTLATFNAAGTSLGKFDLSEFSAGSVEPSVTRLANGLLAVAEVREGLAFINLVDPASGKVLATRDVIGDFSGTDSHDAVVAAFGTGRVAVFYNDPGANLSGGSAFNIVRTSVSDSVPFSTDTINGDDFIDKIFGGDGDDTLNGAGNHDEINGGNGVDTIDGGADDDLIEGGQGFDFIFGGGGNDTIFFMTKDDADGSTSGGQANGDGGNDQITGSAGSETLLGDAGNDTLFGRGANDTLSGGANNDILIGGAADDQLDGGTGFDTASYSGASAGVIASLFNPAGNTGEAAGDTYISIENLAGSSFNDVLSGNNSANAIAGRAGNDFIRGNLGNDVLFGQNGNDTLIGGAGTDVLDGGDGDDTASYATATAGVIANLLFPFLSTGEAAGDTFVSIECLAGSSFNDQLYGNNLINRLAGGAGDDVLRGFLGNDLLFGQAGKDIFLFNTALNATTNVDRIMDFAVVDDTIFLENAIFTALGAAGALPAAAFKSNTTGLAGDASDRIIYETDTGKLFYDADGNAAGFSGVHFATLTAGLALTSADFMVI